MREIQFLDESGVRPTGARVRKVLFDWLRLDVKEAKCLDLFSGSGILAFEAASQGAGYILCVDKNIACCKQIESEACRLNEKRIEVYCKQLPCSIDDQFDICFLDPPFNDSVLYQQMLSWLDDSGCISHGGLLYVEANNELAPQHPWEQLKCKKVSKVYMHLWRYKG